MSQDAAALTWNPEPVTTAGRLAAKFAGGALALCLLVLVDVQAPVLSFPVMLLSALAGTAVVLCCCRRNPTYGIASEALLAYLVTVCLVEMAALLHRLWQLSRRGPVWGNPEWWACLAFVGSAALALVAAVLPGPPEEGKATKQTSILDGDVAISLI